MSRRERGPGPARTGAARPAPARAPAPEVATPPPSLWRDPWALATALAVLPLLVRCAGAPLGEPVADDFDHLYHAMFSRDHSWLGGGGSSSFWRPLVYEGYYSLLQGVIRTHPVWITVLHVALLALVVVLLYDIFRQHLPRHAAACAAAFVLLLESTRALIIVPVHFVDLGLIVFSVVAWRAAESGRLFGSLVALAAALLCKETAVVTALVLPWLARPRAGDTRRLWILATLAVAAAWGALYLWVRAHLSLTLPHGLEARLSPGMVLDPERIAWAVTGTLRALVSLPMRAAEHEWLVAAASALILGAAAVLLATSPAARARLARFKPQIVTGLAWSALATATLLPVHPVWSPERVAYTSLGLGVAAVALLVAAHPALPWALVALRLVTFCLAPSAVATLTREPPDTGAFMDFEKLTRLQRFMSITRRALQAQYPRPAAHAHVLEMNLPHGLMYALGGDRAVQVWYRDTTLSMVNYTRLNQDSTLSMVAGVQFQPGAATPIVLLPPEAMRAQDRAYRRIVTDQWAASFEPLALADSLTPDPRYVVFHADNAGYRAFAYVQLRRYDEAEAEARRSLALVPSERNGLLVLGTVLAVQGRFDEALERLDALLRLDPGQAMAQRLRASVVARREAERRR